MKAVLTLSACARLGELVAICQKQVKVNGKQIGVRTLCRDLQMSPSTFSK